MPDSAKYVLIGSTEPRSGKSTALFAIAFQLQSCGFTVGWGKPLASGDGARDSLECLDTDLNFVPDMLSLGHEQRKPPLLCMDEGTLARQLVQADEADFRDALREYRTESASDVVLLEGPGTLEEGALMHLSLPEMAIALDAAVILVMQFNTRHMVDQIVSAQKRLGRSLLGVVINGVNDANETFMAEVVAPYLENHGIPILATLPQIPFLQGVRVSEIVHHLDADVICCADHLDLVVESLKIGAMNVNAALRFFSQGVHQAVVTGGDRRDLQIAALETSTHCLVLTGQIPPAEDVVALAKDKEVPVLSVATDTLTTVERIDSLFGHVPLNNPDKVSLVKAHLAKKLDLDRLIQLLGLERPAIAPHG